MRKSLRLLPLLALLAISLAGLRASTDDLPSALTRLGAFYRQRLADARVVGSSLFIVRNGQVVAKELVGTADRERSRPVDEDTIYHWASITKTFTAIAIMQLRDRGRLSLDDPVVKYVPELRGVHDPFGDIGEIKIRHLMSHSAGFRGPTWPWGGDKPWHPFEPKQWSQLVAMMPYTEVEFRPGSKYSYSNPGIIFLGRIIEALSGDDYEVYIDKNILKPLGMYRTYFDATPYHLLSHRCASYYVSKEGPLRPAPYDADTGITVSNGGLNAPLPDMVKYLNFLLGQGGSSEAYEGVLKRSSLEEMFVPQIEAGTEGKDRIALGLNFFVEDREGRHLVGHSGSQNAFISHFYICPALKTGYIVAFNTEWEEDADTPKERTRQVDAEVRTYILKNVFPAMEGGATVTENRAFR